MTKREKLLERLLAKPKDFTWDELTRLMGAYGYYPNNKGKTSGSRVQFECENSEDILQIHKPHPSEILKPYQVKAACLFLERIGAMEKSDN